MKYNGLHSYRSILTVSVHQSKQVKDTLSKGYLYNFIAQNNNKNHKYPFLGYAPLVLRVMKGATFYQFKILITKEKLLTKKNNIFSSFFL